MSLETRTSTVVYRNPWICVREDEVEYADGSPGVFGIVDASDFALVVPTDGKRFLLVEQFRYATQLRSWEFPSGSCEPGEEPERAAARELAEETGFTAGQFTPLGMVHPANGTLNQACHLFVATDLTASAPDRDLGEQDMREQWFDREELEQMLRDGTITDGPSVAAYALLRLR